MSKPQPLHLIIAGLKKIPLNEQVSRLCAMVAQEKLHSVRRNELQSLLDGKRSRQSKRQLESQPSMESQT
jgi:hypothetical protein